MAFGIRIIIRGKRNLSEATRSRLMRTLLAVKKELVDVLHDIDRSRQGLINTQTGRLVLSSVVTGFVRSRARLEITAPYALSVEKGARPHEIEARAGGVLRWKGKDGTIRFAKRVHHPGNPPGNQVRDAVAISRRTLRPRILRVLRTQ